MENTPLHKLYKVFEEKYKVTIEHCPNQYAYDTKVTISHGYYKFMILYYKKDDVYQCFMTNRKGHMLFNIYGNGYEMGFALLNYTKSLFDHIEKLCYDIYYEDKQEDIVTCTTWLLKNCRYMLKVMNEIEA